ncbi:MAG: hypothetical protein E5W15_04290 [Mesorhizobium sp.]|uniref:hypothetical protein n=1 Tax=unclassified Mesorhizobium TaxID=325217 RepID=UPI000FCA6CA3|nr:MULTISPECIES: hypothetical protein [unclassified Mesorhizobium]RUW40422.1 hypothetical protein EOA37_15080 [Mesorhizobium sp. M2A.F.Ca.ET.015.02.1.1]RVC97935.1 hypothetical protein EN739_02475 [Mesorhizobium sp. M2A.F.Ca.ET.017.03.2.1]RVD08667.1 hypothetical protein EN753_13290 [Mesorhizobium sp. M2A.F.Ca.ET.029.05.1.1]RWB40626.1 MAG: hypothetical protein EOQ46_24250 [Mesorhizobium sp.]RWB62693.1 MAG: hypothetical protein EOQ48_11235 [Mesorhizobium sp.]
MEISADQNYTLAEASAHLRLTNRAVAKIARRHGLCMAVGRRLLFSEADIEGIKDVLRVAPAAPRQATIKASSDYRLQASLIAMSRKKRGGAA